MGKANKWQPQNNFTCTDDPRSCSQSKNPIKKNTLEPIPTHQIFYEDCCNENFVIEFIQH